MGGSESDQALFYSYMGHAKKINEDVYQHPQAIQEVICVGTYIHKILGNEEKIKKKQKHKHKQKNDQKEIVPFLHDLDHVILV